MVIKTPKILPGEPGWEEAQAEKKDAQEKSKSAKSSKRKTPTQIGKITLGDPGFRFGRLRQTFKGDKKYVVWRYKRRIGEVTVHNENTEDEKVRLTFIRLGGIGNHKHLIQDADFQLKWMTREQELLITQKECYMCKKKISKSAEPNLFHYNLFKKRTELLEKADKVPQEVVDGELTISDGWVKFNQIIEDGNRYYMSLEDTALICASCAKKKGLK